MDELDKQIYLQMKEYATRMVRRQYVTAHGGNISMRIGNIMWITRHASSLEDLRPDDVIRLRVDKPTGNEIVASTETIVHRMVYQKTENMAILHAHPPYSVVMSFFVDELIPPDAEAYYVLKKVPVIEGQSGSKTLAERVSEALSKNLAVIVRAHGVFTASKYMDVAYQLMCMVEHSAHMLYLISMKKQLSPEKFIVPKEF
ncbi:MAG: class II aldolase/adducin family protein [Candidatus Asgardarchaeia archaeon]